MNRASFWRLMWKEYRLQRSFWIAMAALGAMLLFLIMEFNDHPTERGVACLFRPMRAGFLCAGLRVDDVCRRARRGYLRVPAVLAG